MSIAITDEAAALSEAAAKFVDRHAPISATRASFDALAAGGRPDHWSALCAQGLHAVHLSEEVGGQGGSLEDLAVVVEEAGRGLLPGPLVPTVVTSAIVAAASGSRRRESLLAAFAEGATGAVVLPTSGITATRSGDGWSLTGRTAPVLGLMSAEHVLVGAVTDGDGVVWVVLDSHVRDGGRVAEEGVDLTRDVGRLTLDGSRFDSSDSLEGLGGTVAEDIATALFAAEASGVMRWCHEASLGYVRIREQFGVPIGSFQAVKHKAARVFIASELAAAAAWDAARGLTQSDAQRRLASAGAAVVALGRCVDVALEAVTLFGGIGFTWEHDAHLYWRRAVSLASTVGPRAEWERRAGAAVLFEERDFSLELPDEDPQFRAWVGERLDEALALPADAPRRDGGWAAAATGPRRTMLADAGLISSHWPKPYGLSASPIEQIVIAEEYQRRGLDQPSSVIGEWAVPTILAHGTDAQRERLVPPTLRGEITWCQLFSEPGAGSDLAGLSTRAVKVDGGWQLDGQKVWTSSAHEADWGICLARTDPTAPKHKGLSYFLVDMRSPGVEVRPLKQATGDSEFNEVFLTGVFVPDDLIVGEPGQGWRLTATTLANERLSIGSGLGGSRQYEGLRDLVRSGHFGDDEADALRVLGRTVAQATALAAMNLREVMRRLSGLQPGAGSSVAKVASALLARTAADEALALLGPEGALNAAPGGLVLDEISLPSHLIGGGTVEIQLNVIAERVLGLPR